MALAVFAKAPDCPQPCKRPGGARIMEAFS